MSSERLEQQEADRLSALFGELIASSRYRAPFIGESEPTYTGAVIRPLVQSWLQTLKRPALFLRADGGVPPLPVSSGGLFFYPDLEIGAYNERYVALEVKFVRADYNASGAITKALGQALMYRLCGVRYAHVLLLDLRGRRSPQIVPAANFSSLAELGMSIHAVRVSSEAS